MPTIAHYMTKQPWSVEIDDSVALASRMMAEREIRHLPVLDGGKLVGMITERDLARATERTTTVERVMTIAHDVDANTVFADALELMLELQRDALVVTRDDKIEGIFTAMDAVRVLHERMRER